jgi:uncharacterized protein
VNSSQLADVAPRERLIKGEKNWWFIGPRGIARLQDEHLDAEGAVLPRVERSLRDQGLFEVPAYDSYALTVLTSTDCNLGCGYCFQNTEQDPSGGNRPPRIAHARLTPETTTSLLEFTDARMAEAGLDKLTILLFGGEPMLNPKGCRDLLSRAADHGLVSASMVSNGTLLTPLLAKELADLGLTSVQITFDGDREVHDHIRIKRSGGGTFDTIIANMAKVSAVTSIRWSLRVNVSHHNHTGLDKLVEQLGEAMDTSRCNIYFARVGDVGVGYENELLHTGLLADSFLRWQRRALELGFTVARPRAQAPCQTCSFREGRFGAVVNADGVLASCWETAGKPGLEVGTTATGYLPSAETEGRWQSCEDFYRFSDEDRGLASFQNTVDAALLDHLSAVGRL